MEEVKIEVTLTLATKFQNQLVRSMVKEKLFELTNILQQANMKNEIKSVFYNGDDLLFEKLGEIINKIGSK